MSASTAITFTRAAPTYWCSVYPQIRRLLEQQRRAAEEIADPRLREIAQRVLVSKRANIDGAAAFAAFVPSIRRPAVIRAQVAFQSLYDYLDTLAEQPHHDPVLNSRHLHAALSAALDPSTQSSAYRAEEPHGEDARYINDTVASCQTALRALPGYPAVQASASRLAAHIVEYQSFNVTAAPGPQAALAGWAAQRTPPGSGLRWWETAASAGSSLGVFALIAMAAQPHTSTAQACAVENAYFPWIGALHSLLDSLIDLAEDKASAQQALIAHYDGAAETAARLRLLAEESRRRAAALPHAASHAVVLASMASLYLSEREAGSPHARQARRQVLAALGPLAAPSMLVLGLRRLALARHARD